MPACVAWNCRNNSANYPATGFHKFPLDQPPLLELWVHNVNRPDPWAPTADSVLCSDHFPERCFERSGRNTWLRSDALPTIFAYPDDRQQVVIETLPDDLRSREDAREDHSYGSTIAGPVVHETNVRRVRLPEEGESLRKKLKLSRQRVRRLEERVAMLNDMVYSLLNQTIMEM